MPTTAIAMEDETLNDTPTGENSQQKLQFLPINRPESPPHSRRRRAYQSCEPCRKRKSRCVPDKPDQRQPCKRCIADGEQCHFRDTRYSNRRSRHRSSTPSRAQVLSNPSSPGLAHRSADYVQLGSPASTPTTRDHENVHQQETISSTVNELSSTEMPGMSPAPMAERRGPPNEPTARSRIISAQLHNTADALDLLTFAAAGERSKNVESAGALLGDSTGSRGLGHSQGLGGPVTGGQGGPRNESNASWERFVMIKRQILTKSEVLEYLDFYFNTIWSLRPIVPSSYRQKDRYISLATDEPMLLVGLVTLASRYYPLSGSHGEIRSERIHWQAWNLFKKYLQSALWGSPQTRSPGAIAAMLLLVEWHPKSINNPTAFDEENSYDLFGSDGAGLGAYDAESQPLTALTSQQRYGMATLLEDLNIVAPAYRSNKMSWILLSTAIALAQEGCCFDHDLQGPTSHGSSLVSDKDSLRHQWNQLTGVFIYLTDEHLAMRLGLSPLLPESATEAVRNRFSTTFASLLPDSALWESYYELYTETKKARVLFQSLKKAGWPATANVDVLPDLEHIERALTRWKIHRSYVDTSASKLASVCLDLEYHYSVMYSFGPANYALHSKSATGLSERTITGLSRLSNRASQASHEMLSLVVNSLASSNLMKYLPVRSWLFIVAAHLHLLKSTLTDNPHATESDDSIQLLRASVKAIRGGSPDDTHMAVRYARFLEIMLNASMHSSRGQSPSGERAEEQGSGFGPEDGGELDFDYSNLLPASSWDNMTMLDYPHALGNPGDPFQWWTSTFGTTGTLGFQ